MEHHKRIQCFSAQLSAEHEETTGRSDRANDFFKKYSTQDLPRDLGCAEWRYGSARVGLRLP